MAWGFTYLEGTAVGFALAITAFLMSFGGMAIVKLFQDAAEH